MAQSLKPPCSYGRPPRLPEWSVWLEDRLAADSFGQTAIGDGAADAEGTSGRRADGDARPAPVQYGLDRGGGHVVAATPSWRAAGVEKNPNRWVPLLPRQGNVVRPHVSSPCQT
jgi:hypothetical protein